MKKSSSIASAGRPAGSGFGRRRFCRLAEWRVVVFVRQQDNHVAIAVHHHLQVVRNEQDAAAEVAAEIPLDQLVEHAGARHVDALGGFVQHQQVWRPMRRRKPGS